MSKVGAVYLLGSPGDVSEAKKSGVQFRTKLFVTKTGQIKDNQPLYGVKYDLNNMVRFWKQKSMAVAGGLCLPQFSKRDALQSIRQYFNENWASELYVLYYSGHGEEETGNWVFTDGTVSYYDVYELWYQSGKSEAKELWIISDSCFAGNWITAAMRSQRYNCRRILLICSSTSNNISYDIENEGGDFTNKFIRHSGDILKTSAMIGCVSYHNSVRESWTQDNITSTEYIELSLLSKKRIY